MGCSILQRVARWIAPAAAFAAAGCAHLPRERFEACRAPIDHPIRQESGRASTTIDVLTYNIEGLGWPARSGRGPSLARIATILSDLRKSGEGPDLVLFQEAFSGAATRSVEDAGYPELATGPGRTQRGTLRSGLPLPGRARPRKGELGFRLATSGIAIASRFPIVEVVSEPYSRRSCAGFDCLSNKGIMLVRVAIPGVPDPVDILNTHMNSQNASGVAAARHLASHHAQMIELGRFFQTHADDGHPVIMGGDFNMRHSAPRFETFRALQPLDLVHEHCVDPANGCDVRLSWDGDAPWMDTQDLQLFAGGTRVRVAPVRVEAMFDGSAGSPKLSDHDGLRVVYRLSWDAALPGARPCADRDQAAAVR